MSEKAITGSLNPLTIAKLLGPSTPLLDRVIRFLNTVRGTDKVLMNIQYWSKIVVWFLQRRAGPASIKGPAVITLAQHIKNFAGPVSDFRILLRYYGLLPMIQYMAYLEHNPSPSRLHLNLERIQNLSMVIYYPLEHLYWLGAHNAISLSEKKTNSIGIWSCRFWALWVVLEFGRIAEQYRLLKKKETSLIKKIKDGEITDQAEKQQQIASIQSEKKSMLLGTVINTGYLPLTVHWSLENSTFPDVLVGLFGGIAAVCQVYAAWQATP
ncbi:hypothetical protein INT44_005170 [Umbelopsis vinacea]|uniref:Peroxisomal biogenesis factor 11 n=1 Tax=Umbelopsis vinacea TaxID=44442 RepID=A0A8H7Q7Z7_9FUNG|nr:hypothetical protein INT44_005170 [Umbelopsis vinacea]